MNRSKEIISLIEDEANDITVGNAHASNIGPWADAFGNTGVGYHWSDGVKGGKSGNFDIVTHRGHKALPPDKIAFYWKKKGHDRPPQELIDAILNKLRGESHE